MGKVNMKTVKRATVNDALEAFNDFMSQVNRALGKGGQKPHFYEYKVPMGVQNDLSTYTEAIEAGQFDKALEAITSAARGLDATQRYYCNVVAMDRLNRQLNELPELDEDIQASLQKKRTAFESLAKRIRFDKAISLQAASDAYWALYEGICTARAEQDARYRNREDRARLEADEKKRLALVARRNAQEERDTKAREEQAAADARRREEQKKLARDMRSQLAEIFA